MLDSDASSSHEVCRRRRRRRPQKHTNLFLKPRRRNETSEEKKTKTKMKTKTKTKTGAREDVKTAASTENVNDENELVAKASSTACMTVAVIVVFWSTVSSVVCLIGCCILFHELLSNI